MTKSGFKKAEYRDPAHLYKMSIPGLKWLCLFANKEEEAVIKGIIEKKVLEARACESFAKFLRAALRRKKRRRRFMRKITGALHKRGSKKHKSRES